MTPERETAICNRGEDSKCDFLSYDTVYSGRWVPTFQRRTPTPSWGMQWERSDMKEHRLSAVRVKMRSERRSAGEKWKWKWKWK